MLRFALAALPLAALAACAAPAVDAPLQTAAGDRPCFLAQTVGNLSTDDMTAFYVRAGGETVLQLDTGGCTHLGATTRIRILTAPRVCVGDEVILTSSQSTMDRGTTWENRCRAVVSRSLSRSAFNAARSAE